LFETASCATALLAFLPVSAVEVGLYSGSVFFISLFSALELKTDRSLTEHILNDACFHIDLLQFEGMAT
jgi:hypothetical protein